MSFQGSRLLLAISWILRLKKNLLVSLTVFLKLFQSSSFLDVLYLFRDWLHSLFHYFLECFVILTHLVFLPHAHSMFVAICQIRSIEVFYDSHNLIDKCDFFFAILWYGELGWIDVLLNNGNRYCKGGCDLRWDIDWGKLSDCWVQLICFKET